MFRKYFIIVFFFFTSCIVQSPQYTSLEQVMSLHVGMTKEQVEKTLDLAPYDVKAYTDSSDVFIYVYRTIDRRTLSFYTKKKNGRKAIGRYVQLYVAYSKKTNKVINIESCGDCNDNLVTTSRVDFEKVITFVSVTLPVILVYIGLKSGK
ncbi:MAG TPA: hypothetical protein VNB90_02030 [Cytophagaceae bacterium]|nr:hypothetical protein [Cytophagaceae bacterium]